MNIAIVIPTYNEDLVIGQNLRTSVLAFDRLFAGHEWVILVADNGSSDKTAAYADECPRVGLLDVGRKGKGLAIREAWRLLDADVYAFMDADLATDLDDLPALIDGAVRTGIAAGSRFHRDAIVTRSFLRRVVSRAYRLAARMLVPVAAQDLQCGFKAIRHDVAEKILPMLTHDDFFFDTELLAHAERHGFVVSNVPVRWEEGRDPRRKTSVKICATAWDNFRHLWTLRKALKTSRS